MQYQGDLYGKIGRKYLKLEMNSDDVDGLILSKEAYRNKNMTYFKQISQLEKENNQLKKENAEYESEAREVNIRADKYIKRTVPKLVKAREIIQKLLEEEKENMYWEMNGSDKSSYFKIKKEAEEFIEHVFENEKD